jgi:putative DNA methylase
MTIPKECKRLAEVDFPIAEVSKHAAREKSIRQGHPSTLHLWWARRPLASSRAVLMALLLPDPVDPLCPSNFKTQARELLSEVLKPGTGDEGLRAGLLKFIGDFANWDLASNQQYINVSRKLVKAAYPDEPPLVVDPFTGGGSIPLEALRLGCDSFASDLNPVAGLIQKVMLEDIPRFGKQKIKVHTAQGEVETDGMADALRLVGREIRKAAEKELTEYYPPDTDAVHPIAYLWARTVRCESPNCGAEIPLMKSFWLNRKSNRKSAFRVKSKKQIVEFEIIEPAKESDVRTGTVSRAKATCLCCGKVLSPDRVRAQLREQHGGANVIFDSRGNRTGGARMTAVIMQNKSERGRYYRLPNERDYEAVWQAQKQLQRLAIETLPDGMSTIPDESTPWQHGHRAIGSARLYGMDKWSDLFTSRQILTIIELIRQLHKQTTSISNSFLAIPLSRFIDDFSALARWMDRGTPAPTFTRHDIPMVWDFCEIWPFDDASWSLSGSFEWVAKAIEKMPLLQPGQTQLADACKSPLLDQTVSVWFTDPPYYDAVPYADISDFFFVWLKRMLPNNANLRDPFDPQNPLTPKQEELTVTTVASEDAEPKTQAFFEKGMASAFSEGRRVLMDDGVGCVVFAHKTTEGWESLLSGMIQGGWNLKASWPIVTERSGRLNARETAALATSVHLVCRPRTDNVIGDWIQVSRELPRKVGDWMQRLQNEGVRGADLVFACIGPALEIYSRYSKVVDAEDREIPLGGDPEAREPHLRGYLAYVWETVGRLALEQVLGTSEAQKDATNALEEDARLTALFLWTQGATSPTAEKSKAKSAEFDEEPEVEDDEEDAPKKKSKGGFTLPFDVVRRFAQPLGIHLPEWEKRIIDTDKGVVTLLSVKDRARQLFGEDGASAFASEIEDNPIKSMQMSLFAEVETAPKVRGRRKSKKDGDISFNEKREATTLDRLHAAMLLQKGGQTTALRALLQAESERGSDFMRLANALTALYPRESEEKRLLDALLVNVRR